MNNTNQNNDWSKRDIGALWKREGKNQKYLSGYFKLENGQEVKVVVFSNKNKQNNEKAPDYRVYLSQPSEQQQQQTAVKSQNKPKAQAVKKVEVEEEEEEEELL